MSIKGQLTCTVQLPTPPRPPPYLSLRFHAFAQTGKKNAYQDTKPSLAVSGHSLYKVLRYFVSVDPLVGFADEAGSETKLSKYSMEGGGIFFPLGPFRLGCGKANDHRRPNFLSTIQYCISRYSTGTRTEYTLVESAARGGAHERPSPCFCVGDGDGIRMHILILILTRSY